MVEMQYSIVVLTSDFFSCRAHEPQNGWLRKDIHELDVYSFEQCSTNTIDNRYYGILPDYTNTRNFVKLSVQDLAVRTPHTTLRNFIIGLDFSSTSGNSLGVYHKFPKKRSATGDLEASWKKVVQIIRRDHKVLQEKHTPLIILIKSSVNGESQMGKAGSHKGSALGKVKDSDFGDDGFDQPDIVDI